MCWYTHVKPFVPHETMVKRMVLSISSARNVHGVVNDKTTSYKTMVMNAMRMNQGHTSQYPIINEKPTYLD